jgi:peptide/nickel transport system permease protein
LLSLTFQVVPVSANGLARRALHAAWLILLLIALNFTLIRLAPGDPAHLLAGQSGDEQYLQFIRAKFGLDQPLPVQFARYVAGLARGDFGYSFAYQQPVAHLVASRVPATLLLMATALLLSTAGGVGLGVEAARRAGAPVDRAVTAFAAASDAVPSFCIGQAALLVFAYGLGLIPAQGMASLGGELTGAARAWDVAGHLIAPALTLALAQVGLIVRLVRTQMVEALRADFITAARARGIGPRRLAWRHALRTCVLPVVAVVGNEFGMLLSGAVLVETVFAWPGLGRLMMDAVALRDYPVLLGLSLLVSIGVVVAGFVTDAVYVRLDPRIAHQAKA